MCVSGPVLFHVSGAGCLKRRRDSQGFHFAKFALELLALGSRLVLFTTHWGAWYTRHMNLHVDGAVGGIKS